MKKYTLFIIFMILMHPAFSWTSQQDDWKSFFQLQLLQQRNASFQLPTPVNALKEDLLHFIYIPGSSLNVGIGKGIELLSMPRLFIPDNLEKNRIGLKTGYLYGEFTKYSGGMDIDGSDQYIPKFRMQYATTAVFLEKIEISDEYYWKLHQADGKDYFFTKDGRIKEIRNQYKKNIVFVWEGDHLKIIKSSELWNIFFSYDRKLGNLEGVYYFLSGGVRRGGVLFKYDSENHLVDVRWEQGQNPLFTAHYDDNLLTYQPLPLGGKVVYQYQKTSPDQGEEPIWWPNSIEKITAEGQIIEKSQFQLVSYKKDKEIQIKEITSQFKEETLISSPDERTQLIIKKKNGVTYYEEKREFVNLYDIWNLSKLTINNVLKNEKLFYKIYYHFKTYPDEITFERRSDARLETCQFKMAYFAPEDLYVTKDIICSDPAHTVYQQLSSRGEVLQVQDSNRRSFLDYQFDDEGRIVFINDSKKLKKYEFKYADDSVLPKEEKINGVPVFKGSIDELTGFPVSIQDITGDRFDFKYNIDNSLIKVTKQEPSSDHAETYYELKSDINSTQGKNQIDFYLMGKPITALVSDFGLNENDEHKADEDGNGKKCEQMCGHDTKIPFYWNIKGEEFCEPQSGLIWECNNNGDIASCRGYGNSAYSFEYDSRCIRYENGKTIIFYNGAETTYKDGVAIKRVFPYIAKNVQNDKENKTDVSFEYLFGKKISEAVYYNYLNQKIYSIFYKLEANGKISQRRVPNYIEKYRYGNFDKIQIIEKTLTNRDTSIKYHFNNDGKINAIAPFIPTIKTSNQGESKIESYLYDTPFKLDGTKTSLHYTFADRTLYYESLKYDAEGNVVAIKESVDGLPKTKKNFQYSKNNVLIDSESSNIESERNEKGQITTIVKRESEPSPKISLLWKRDRPYRIKIEYDDSNQIDRKFNVYYDENDTLLGVCPSDIKMAQGIRECFIRYGEHSYQYEDSEFHLISDGNRALALLVNDKRYNLITDHLGSVRGMTTLEGKLIWWREYGSWGKKEKVTYFNSWLDDGDAVYQKKLAKWLESRTIWSYAHLIEVPMLSHKKLKLNFYWSKTRTYVPELKEWLSVDPLMKWNPQRLASSPENWHPYHYALNNPLTYTDENGEFIQCLVGAIIGAITSVAFDAIIQKKENFNFFKSFARGAVIGGLTGGVGSFLSAPGGIAYNIGHSVFTNEVLTQLTTHAITGALMGMTTAGANTILNSVFNGERINFHNASKSILKGGAIGGITGFITSCMSAPFQELEFYQKINGSNQMIFKTAENSFTNQCLQQIGNLNPAAFLFNSAISMMAKFFTYEMVGEEFNFKQQVLTDVLTYGANLFTSSTLYLLSEEKFSQTKTQLDKIMERRYAEEGSVNNVQQENNSEDENRVFVVEGKKPGRTTIQVVPTESFKEGQKKAIIDVVRNSKETSKYPLYTIKNESQRVNVDTPKNYVEQYVRANGYDFYSDKYEMSYLNFTPEQISFSMPFKPAGSHITPMKYGDHPIMGALQYIKNKTWNVSDSSKIRLDRITQELIDYTHQTYKELAPEMLVEMGIIESPSLRPGVFTQTPLEEMFTSSRTCFTEETPILTENGYLPIREVERTNKVCSFNLGSNKMEVCAVEEVKKMSADRLLNIILESGELIRVTTDHPFYTKKGNWVLAENLQGGDELFNFVGEGVKVKEVKEEKLEQGEIPVYNIIVKKNGNYFIGNGRYLVHNCGQSRYAFGSNKTLVMSYDAYSFIKDIKDNWPKLRRGIESVGNTGKTSNNDFSFFDVRGFYERNTERPIFQLVSRAALLQMACFTGETLVHTPDGYKEIAKMQEGDRVLACDEKNGVCEIKTVTQKYNGISQRIVELTLDNETINVTPNHPFYIDGEGWKRANELVTGNQVKTFNGHSSNVMKISFKEGNYQVYNLAVGDYQFTDLTFKNEYLGNSLIETKRGILSMANVLPGDYVKENQKNIFKLVTNKTIKAVSELLVLHTEDEFGHKVTFKITRDHIFYRGDGAEVRGWELTTGVKLPVRGRLLLITKITNELGNFDLYHLESDPHSQVDPSCLFPLANNSKSQKSLDEDAFHTYYVGKCGDGALVHNCHAGRTGLGSVIPGSDAAISLGEGLVGWDVCEWKKLNPTERWIKGADSVQNLVPPLVRMTYKGAKAAYKIANKEGQSSVASKDIKEAERALKQNKDFRDWFHREYKQDQVQKIKDRHNPDLSPEQIHEAYKEWQEWGNPRR